MAEAEPEIEPNIAEDSTDTLPAPPRRRPAASVATFMKPCPASPAFSTAPRMTKIETMPTDTPVSEPQMPPSVMVMVPRKLAKGKPGWPYSPGTYWPNRP